MRQVTLELTLGLGYEAVNRRSRDDYDGMCGSTVNLHSALIKASLHLAA
jgi:hypothetical protein